MFQGFSNFQGLYPSCWIELARRAESTELERAAVLGVAAGERVNEAAADRHGHRHACQPMPRQEAPRLSVVSIAGLTGASSRGRTVAADGFDAESTGPRGDRRPRPDRPHPFDGSGRRPPVPAVVPPVVPPVAVPPVAVPPVVPPVSVPPVAVPPVVPPVSVPPVAVPPVVPPVSVPAVVFMPSVLPVPVVVLVLTVVAGVSVVAVVPVVPVPSVVVVVVVVDSSSSSGQPSTTTEEPSTSVKEMVQRLCMAIIHERCARSRKAVQDEVSKAGAGACSARSVAQAAATCGGLTMTTRGIFEFAVLVRARQ
ncbi:hypothetical protein [Nannocystis exedens]|uniref:hypothetical protein n=1 Tax=Nannocystis exedens TaxID=54 RepID=UPI000C29844B|nr:hypothetical protein [Nannocystis exedens]